MTDKTGHDFSTTILSLRFSAGFIGSLVGSYDTSYAYPDTPRLKINGTQGRIMIDDTVRRYSFQSTGNESGEVWEAGFFNDRGREFHQTFDAHIDALISAFKQGQPPPIYAKAGCRVAKTEDSAEQALVL